MMSQNTGTLVFVAVLIILFLAVFAGVFVLVIILAINSLKRRSNPSPPQYGYINQPLQYRNAEGINSGALRIPYTIKFDKSSYIKIYIILGAVFSIAIIGVNLYSIFVYKSLSPWISLLIIALYTVIVTLNWLTGSRINIQLLKDRFIYSISNSSTTVFYNHITSITFYKNYIHLSKGSKISYYFRFHGNFPPTGFVAVDLKPFKEEDMTVLIQAVTSRNPSISLDEAAAMVARGTAWSSLS